jgi:hypothetical protein
LTSTVPPLGISIRHRGDPALEHQFDHRMRTAAALNGASVTTGHPDGVGEALTAHPGGDDVNVTPDVIGCRF